MAAMSLIGYLLVDLLEAGFGANLRLGPEFLEEHWLAVFYGHPVRARKAQVASIGLECAEDSHRHHWGY